MPRPTWIANAADVLLSELTELGFSVSREHAHALVRERVSYVASSMGLSEVSARRYFTEDAVRDLARTIAFSFAEEHPGADIFALPRDVLVPLALFGRAVAGLAEAMRVHLGNESAESGAERIAHIAQELSAAGQILADSRVTPAGVAMPRALVLRIARYLDAAGRLLASGGTVADLEPEECSFLARALCDDAARLRAEANRRRSG